MNSSLNYSKCSVFADGTEMNCPLCGVRVHQGGLHECSLPAIASAKTQRDSCAEPQAHVGRDPAEPAQRAISVEEKTS